MFSWPTKVWEPGEITEDGTQLWYSRSPIKEDFERRRAYEVAYNVRQAEE
jgi:hypothetical protein